MINNPKMAAILGMRLVSTRRYCFQFLGADAAAGKQDGIARTIGRREAFKVFLGVHLIRELRFTLEEAKRLLAILEPVIEKKKLPPAIMPPPWEPIEVFIYKANNEAGFYLELKTIKSQQREMQAGRGVWSEVYQIEAINPDPKTGAFPMHLSHFSASFNLTRMVELYCKREAGEMKRAEL